MNICLVAHYAYRALADRSSGHIGGVERQISLMSRWLAERDHRVSVVVWDEGQPAESVIDGVRILKLCRQDAGWPVLRFFVPRWTSLIRALRLADADLYYHNCAEYVTGQVALWARRHGRRFVYSVASDPECDPALDILPSLRERLLYRKGLAIADAVITQSERQSAMLRDGFGIPSTVLPMPCESPRTMAVDSDRNGARVLWIGRIDPIKRVELVLDAASRCPDVAFDIVGPAGGDVAYVESIDARARTLPNVFMHGAVDFADVGRFYQSADLLCCTSRFEGFPNTFLEGWSLGLPVVSTVDPDGLIERLALGVAVPEPGMMAESIETLLADRPRLTEYAANAKAYFAENHDKDVAMRRFESLFSRVASDGGIGSRDERV